MDDLTLPPLPDGKAVVRGPVSAFQDPECGSIVDFDCEGPLAHQPADDEELFTDDQMREYALAAVAMERERCAKLCETLGDGEAAPWFIAQEIRKGE